MVPNSISQAMTNNLGFMFSVDDTTQSVYNQHPARQIELMTGKKIVNVVVAIS